MIRYTIVALLLLTGCTTYAERVSNTCSRLGFPPGSEHYWDCTYQQQEIDQRDRAMGGAMAISGAALMMRPAPIYVIH